MSLIIWHEREEAKTIEPGIKLDKIERGGRLGPDNLVRNLEPLGQVWTSRYVLGTESDDFTMTIPDVRMPPNQYYPLHWHGCWIAVIVLDGTCLIGDWWMQRGDVLISRDNIEYGPLVNGPDGCQMFEVFAKTDLSMGGYAPEYADHPTLGEIPKVVAERSPQNKINEGRQILPIKDGSAYGIEIGRLDPGKLWELGEPNDPDRGAFMAASLAAGEKREACQYEDWHAIYVMEGELILGGRTLVRNDVLVVEPGKKLEAITAGASGAELVDFARTIKGLAPQILA